MPIDETVLAAMVTAAKFSTAQLERISQAVLSVSLSEISLASTPAEQAKDLISYAVQYQLEREVAAELLVAGAGRPGMQNLLLGDESMVNQTDDQRNTAMNALDIVRLENRVVRMEDKLDAAVQRLEALTHKVENFLQRTPLNWHVVIYGITLAILAGLVLWIVAAVG